MGQQPASAAVADEDHLDGCLCDLKIADNDLTSDADLPPATGGVAASAAQHDEQPDLEGCGIAATADELTPDDALPAAVGGVG
jgi:hypothetical protein